MKNQIFPAFEDLIIQIFGIKIQNKLTKSTFSKMNFLNKNMRFDTLCASEGGLGEKKFE